jgi:hypothetical protein
VRARKPFGITSTRIVSHPAARARKRMAWSLEGRCVRAP